ncbi:MAG TPA: PQQ-binding-like beta-propeller repeat protein [Planctomycetota bacterium]|nr:PQQ-binding-like beta-propeller repeat protein [Planctomycetota bacterium]
MIRLQTVIVMALVLAGSSAVFAGEAPPEAPKPLDPYTTTLPIYLLPDTAADGNLAEWAGIPPSATPDRIKPFDKDTLAATDDDFAPFLYCGRKNNSPDIFFLVIVKDLHTWSPDAPNWLDGDGLDLYLDFGRVNRPVADAEAVKQNKNWANCPEMGQLGMRPRNFLAAGKAYQATGMKVWKTDYASMPVEGGMAYEVRVDGKSVLDNLKLAELPPYIGIDLGITEQDYPVYLRADAWSNRLGIFRIFGDGMNHAFPIKYGMLSLQPGEAGVQVAPLPKTMQSLYGEFPTADDIAKLCKQVEEKQVVPAKLGDLVSWATLQGAALDEPLVRRLMGIGQPRLAESVLAAMMYTTQDEAVVKAAVELAYKDVAAAGPHALVLANLVCDKLSLDYRTAYRAQLSLEDPTAVFTAARCLAKVGNVDDAEFLKQARHAAVVDLERRVAAKEAGAADTLRGYTVYLGEALDTLLARTTPIPVPKSVTERKILADNTDLPRHLPIDNNNVYNAKSLLRTWPKEGPKELWRAEIGTSLTCVIEAEGKTFVVGKAADNKVFCWCFESLTGKMLWQYKMSEAGEQNVSPVADGDRVYVVTPSVVCLNAKDGTELWKSDNAFRGTQYSTPLIVGDTIYVPASQPSGLVAADKLTGKLLWNVPPGLTASCGSPAYQIVEGIPQIVIGMSEGYNKPEVWGVDAKTGEIFWKRPFNGQYGLTSSPVGSGYRVLVCCGHGPFYSQVLQVFARDGKLQARLAYHKEGMQQNSHNTPAVVDGCVYGFGGKGLQCSKLEDGTVLWNQPWSSLDRHLIAADGLLFISTKEGDIVMAEASKEAYKELGRAATGVNLGGNTQQMTIANGRLYVRSEKHVVCYDLVNPKQ